MYWVASPTGAATGATGVATGAAGVATGRSVAGAAAGAADAEAAAGAARAPGSEMLLGWVGSIPGVPGAPPESAPAAGCTETRIVGASGGRLWGLPRRTPGWAREESSDPMPKRFKKSRNAT